jgi:hypothetical protein
MKNRFLWMVLTGCLVSMVAGCSSTSGMHDAYVFPKVEGRVVNAETKEPINGVIVLRKHWSGAADVDEYVSAGEIQMQDVRIYTNDKGEFVVPSQRSLEVGGDQSWFSVTLKFMHTDYHMYSTNYLNRSGPPTGNEPLVQAGDIELIPMPTSSERGK